MSSEYRKQVRQHLLGFFGVTPVPRSWHSDALGDVTSFEVPPNDIVPHYTYISCGLAKISSSGIPIELAIASPFQTPEHSELFAMLCVAIKARGKHFGLTDLIQLGRPWIYGADADQLLVSLPYPYGPAFENLKTPLDTISIHWLMPVYSSEATFMSKYGVEALELKFDEEGADYSNPNRPPVV